MTSDEGALLLREADRLFEVSVRLGDVLPTTANFSVFAAVLVNIVRRIGLHGTTPRRRGIEPDAGETVSRSPRTTGQTPEKAPSARRRRQNARRLQIAPHTAEIATARTLVRYAG